MHVPRVGLDQSGLSLCRGPFEQFYTKAEFIAEYGGTEQWDAAAPLFSPEERRQSEVASEAGSR